jgi:DNA repair protein RecO (recombination protein O)
MTLLDLVVYHREKNDLQHLRDVEISEPFHSIASDLRKSTIALFLSEILMKALHDGEQNDEMFSFISSSLRFLDIQAKGIEYFHLFFLARLSLYLGFYPRGKPTREDQYFDLREGRFSSGVPNHPDHLSRELGIRLYQLTGIQPGELEMLNIEKQTRLDLLHALLLYYRIHMSGLGSIRSAPILQEVFH